MALEHAARHLGIAVHTRLVFVTLGLYGTGGYHALPYVGTRLALGCMGQLAHRHSLHHEAGDRLRPAARHGQGKASAARALIDDDTPAPAHARFRWRSLAALLLAGLALWAAPIGLLTAACGWQHPFTQMAWFFTKAALLTFGGAYAVLPYVYQGAVSHYGWLSPAQMIDGLALGETTPGPLIMVVAFAGFIGGYTQAVFGAEHLFLAGAAAAVIVTWFTFLPSFLFIFAGGPLIESTHNDLKFTAPLTAITAAVVGVILNLALFFGYHVLWPNGFEGRFEWISAVIALAAAIALFRYKQNVIHVIAACAAAGLAASLLLK